MSNFHYNDQTSCKSCAERTDYSSLAGTTDYSCDQACMCRFSSERSTMDQMMYDYFVLGKPVNLKPMVAENFTVNFPRGIPHSQR